MTRIPGESLDDVPPDQGDDLPIVVLDDEVEPPVLALGLPLLRDLHALAVRHLGSTAGMTALAQAGLDQPDIVAAYKPGFLPDGLHDLVPTDAQAAFAGRDLAGKIVLPAFDERGVVVDLFVVGGPASLWDQPRGLLAPVLATACTSLGITDTVVGIGVGFQAGQPTLLLRGPADAMANVERLRAGGVQQVTGTSAELLDSLASLQGPPTPTNPVAATTTGLVLVQHDARAERATFTAGLLTIDAQVPHRGRTKLDISLSANGRTDRQTIDLSVVTQRLRFARTAALKLGLAAGTIAATLADLLPALQALAKPEPVLQATTPAADVPDLLRAPDLLERILADCATLGWTGERRAVVLLSAISRLAVDPVWTAQTATTPDERFPALDVLLRITPPEALIHASRLTDNALAHLDADALRHRLLILDEATAIAPAVATALGILRARGSLTGTEVQRDGIAGRMRTQARTIPGPLAVVTATTGTVPPTLRRHLLQVAVDDGADQASTLFIMRQQRLATPTTDPAAIIARLHAAQRALQPLPVIVPDLGEVPDAIRQHRSLHDSFFGLVTASALLHQFQRSRCDGHVAANAADVALAVRLLTPLVPAQVDGLPLRAQQLRAAIRSAGAATFTMADVQRWFPDWASTTQRRAIDDLIAADAVVVVRGRQGLRRSYQWTGDVTLTMATGPAAEVACG
jgi:hypothetical protein